MEWIVERYRNISWDALCEREQEAVERAAWGQATLIYAEPKATFTAGRGAAPEHLVWSPEECRSRGIALAKANRGGQWTYHGPGQLVVYPICSVEALGLHSKATRQYMDRFRTAVAAWLGSFGIIPTQREDRPFGLYVGSEKLVAFGVSLEGGVTHGGMACYLTDQNPYFEGLVPCGISGERMTHLKELNGNWPSAADRLTPFLKEGLIPDRDRVSSGVQEESHERVSNT